MYKKYSHIILYKQWILMKWNKKISATAHTICWCETLNTTGIRIRTQTITCQSGTLPTRPRNTGKIPFSSPIYIPFKYYTLVSVHFLPTWTYNFWKTYVIWPTLSLHITFASATEMLAPNWKIHSNLCHYVAIVESSKDSSLRMWVPVKFSICQRSSSNWLIWLTDFIREVCRTVMSHVRIIQLRVIQHSYKCNTEVNPKTVGIDDAKKSHDCHHQSTRRKPNTISLHCDLHTKQHACNV